MSTDDMYRASINELVSTFRAGLLALVPVADRAQLNWKDEDTHPEWERLAERLFDTFVRQPVETSARKHSVFPLARYDIDSDSYERLSWISVATPELGDAALVRFLSLASPFDTAQIVQIDTSTLEARHRHLVPFEKVSYSTVLNNFDRSRFSVNEVTVDD